MTTETRSTEQQHADIINTLEMAGVPVRPDDLARGVRQLRSLWCAANRTADYYRERSLPRPHQKPEDCPTYHDGCNCTVECLEHNIERAEKAEVELKTKAQRISELEREIADLTAQRDLSLDG